MEKSKKELKNEYKRMKFPMGVFQIKNTQNEMVLIDVSTDMESKWNRHKTELKFGSHRNKLLQMDWNKYGANNFHFEVLSELEDSDNENIDYKEELNVLKNMILEDLGTNNTY